jgi:hypothetical protein
VLVIAAVLAGAELAAAAAVIADYARQGKRSFDSPNALVRDADLDPLALYVPTEALVRARALIPRDATYAVVVGDDPPVADPAGVLGAFRFWLPPRRYTDRLADADWVIAYHHSSETLGVDYSRELGLSRDVNAVEVEE